MEESKRKKKNNIISYKRAKIKQSIHNLENIRLKNTNFTVKIELCGTNDINFDNTLA